MIALIVKATEKCNSNCAYCAGNRGAEENASLSLETAGDILRRIEEYLASRPDAEVQILWHGGEPLLLGSAFFGSLPDLQSCLCPRTSARIRHGIQTNLTLFDERFAESFKALGITSVGTSYDPEPHIRGPGSEIDSSTYNRMFMRGLSVLERFGIGWWMIYVVTRKSLIDPVGIFRLLTNLQTEGNITLNPVLIAGADPYALSITPAEFAGFLSALLPSWWKDRHRLSTLGPFGPVTEAIMNQRMPAEGLNFGACGPSLDHLEIDPSGWMYSIGLPELGGRQKYGNVADTPLESALEKNQCAEKSRRTAWLQDVRCGRCSIQDLCHGPPPHEAAFMANSFISPSPWCEARAAFVEQVRLLAEARPPSRSAGDQERTPAFMSGTIDLPARSSAEDAG